MENKEVLEYIEHAFELKSQQCYKQAIEMLYKALEYESDNIEVLFQIGELYFLMQNMQRAIQYFEKVIAKKPEHQDSLAMLRKIYTLMNMYDEAIIYAEKLFKENETPHNLTELIKLFGLTKNYDKIEEFKNSNLVNDEVNYAIAYMYYAQGKIDDAKNILENITENDDALILLGKIYFDKNHFKESKEVFSKLPPNYEHAEVLNYRGLFYLEDMNFMEAIKSFSKALNLDKQNACYAYNLGNAYFFNGWINEAVKSYLNAVCIAPDVLDYRYSLAYLYYETKSFEKAQKEVDYILEKNSKHSQSIVLNALLKYQNKDFLGAKNDLENVLKTVHDDFALTSLIKVYKELELFESAEKLLKPLIEKSAEKLSYKCDYAEILIAQNKYDEAIQVLEKVIAANENYIQAYGLLANASYLKNDLEKTKDCAQRAISIDMNYAPGYYYLALVRIEEKDYDEAVECMKRALTYDLNNAEYYAVMSNIYEHKDEFKTALDYASEAAELDNSTKYKVLYTNLANLIRKDKKNNKNTCPLKK